jgi:hypothetical protein
VVGHKLSRHPQHPVPADGEQGAVPDHLVHLADRQFKPLGDVR